MNRIEGGVAPVVFGRVDVPLLTAAEAAAADRSARERHGVPERVLMENAGRAAALIIEQLYPRGRVVGVAGSGNNGGDLLVVLRVLRSWGRDVALICAGSRPPDTALLHGVDVPSTESGEAGALLLAGAGVVVDGILGTGSTGAPRGPAAEWVTRINAANRPVVALDLPSGVDATTGAVVGDAVCAAVTVTFGWPKLGLLLHPARQSCGRLIAVEIGFPEDCAASHAWAITSGMARQRLQQRRPDAHKGSSGRLVVLAGSRGMAGAAALTTRAAIRSGAGLVRVASVADNRQILQTLVAEATFLDAATLDAADVEPMHAVAAGPGLGTDDTARASLFRLLELTTARPALLDADALNLMAADPTGLKQAAAGRPLVITPHAQELSRLTGEALDAILADAPAAARAAAATFGCTVLLKGQPSLVALPDGRLFINTTGSSDTATAGMGDQLAGVISALLAGGATAADAAIVGLYLSGRAADLAGLGRSLTPDDVSAHMSAALADPGPVRPPPGLPFVTFDQTERW
jgi:ADP-dependent NAD(P)H-hydrate dehydratase / NAD(P)H-hydrate epimerase